MHLTLIETGGTICMTAGPNGLRPAPEKVAAALAQIAPGQRLDHQKLDPLIDSADLGPTVWNALLDRIDAAPGPVIITHGTDTMEETGIFLHATLGKLASHYKKAVVLTGAMLPANADHSDGQTNLKSALLLAKQAKEAQQFGILAIMAGKPCLARELSKQHTHALDALVVNARELDGPIHKRQADLHLPAEANWPWVEIVTSHAGAKPKLVEMLVSVGVQGIVVAGTGQGSVNKVLAEQLIFAAEQGVAVIRSSRTGAGAVFSEIPEPDQSWNWLCARDLSAPKARIALQLSLLEANSRKTDDWQSIFATI